MKKSLRAFGIGLFLAGAALTLYEKIDGPISNDQTAAYKEEIKNLKASLKQANDKLDKTVPVSAKQDNTNEQTKSSTTAETEQSEKIVYGSIYIYEGVTLYDIGKQAEDVGVVENGRELELFLYKKEYARSIQKGQFDLNSSMTLEEIAKIITGKKIPE